MVSAQLPTLRLQTLEQKKKNDHGWLLTAAKYI